MRGPPWNAEHVVTGVTGGVVDNCPRKRYVAAARHEVEHAVISGLCIRSADLDTEAM